MPVMQWVNKEKGNGSRWTGSSFRKMLMRKCMDLPQLKVSNSFLEATLKRRLAATKAETKYVMSTHLKYAPDSAWWLSNDGRGNY